jgi:cell division protein FtsB
MPRRPTEPRAPREAHDEHGGGRAWLREFQITGFTLAVFVLIVAALVSLAPSLKTLVEQRQQIAELEQSVLEAQDAVDELGDEIARWDDPVYVESQARDRLFYVFPGEKAYLLIGGDEPGDHDGDVPVSDEIQSTRVDWVGSLLGSVVEAGLTRATPDELESPGSAPGASDGGDAG